MPTFNYDQVLREHNELSHCTTIEHIHYCPTLLNRKCWNALELVRDHDRNQWWLLLHGALHMDGIQFCPYCGESLATPVTPQSLEQAFGERKAWDSLVDQLLSTDLWREH